MDHGNLHENSRAAGSSRGKIAFAVMLAIAAFFFLSEHRAHVLGFLPYLLILACPLMHLFHHGGHGGHGQQQRRHGEDAPTDVEERKS